MSEKYGKIVQVIGPVVDVMFDGDDNIIPPIYTALKVVRPDNSELILEVERTSVKRPCAVWPWRVPTVCSAARVLTTWSVR